MTGTGEMTKQEKIRKILEDCIQEDEYHVGNDNYAYGVVGFDTEKAVKALMTLLK